MQLGTTGLSVGYMYNETRMDRDPLHVGICVFWCKEAAVRGAYS